MPLDRAIIALDQARAAITDRQASYGSPSASFDRTAAIFQAILAGKLKSGCTISAADAVMLMAGLKLARLVETPDHLDSAVDLAGYASLIQEVI
jgi:hypothetical protein